jgi:hypothetical protein
MTFEHLNTIFYHVRNCVDNLYPWKDIAGKKVSKLRSIAELRAFYGNMQYIIAD